MMIPNAFAFERHYRELNLPVAIVAGECDRIVDIEKQSARLHRDIAHSSLHRLAGVGHMVHQSAPERLMAAIDEVVGGR
ncbi:alpha/beta hydrolase [Alsobacter sp. SYSU M60028]|uniref:Alpha/beta hydrolase n=1 Tax=Alsobacter ponti TaxID=2962936 RepID=A0ABT1L7I8_9HYPH|nr:alpha/beta hydrolase [Alsobacter ponti]MCP8937439.1 alpha/beta hydrolase [Alsobacter ponti]